MENEKEVETKPGIIYMSRIPPSMNPLKLRNILSQFGEVGRIFLQPEDRDNRKRRKKSGGSGRKRFTEGWVEFTDKKIAKSVAVSLNNTTIGGKKRYYFHDDIWNMKYLSKFNWGHISEKLAYEKAAREQRMRTEISQARREVNAYLDNVNKGKVHAAIEERKKKKRKADDNESEKPTKVTKLHHRQKSVVEEKSESFPSKPALNKGLLEKIFAKKVT